jgi:hypothetical protein
MNWHEIVSKRTPVKSNDNANCGYVASEYGDNLVVIEGKWISSEYMIPKDIVKGYDGRELSLKIRYDEIGLDFRI